METTNTYPRAGWAEPRKRHAHRLVRRSQRHTQHILRSDPSNRGTAPGTGTTNLHLQDPGRRISIEEVAKDVSRGE